jgi:uncharacterized membrane protein YcaP (DUF421 family)
MPGSIHGNIEYATSHPLLFGKEPVNFLAEIIIRAVVMYVVVLVSVRMIGRRGVKQLSAFELVTILVLGSAAGDPMLYREVGVVTSAVVFLMVVFLYRLVIYLLSRSRKFEILVKGKPDYLIKEGVFCYEEFRKQPLALYEFFAELRMQGVSHLGQVKYAIIETSGEITVFFYNNADVRYGLCILPYLDKDVEQIDTEALYACNTCGHVKHLQPVDRFNCPVCNNHIWAKAVNDARVS